MIGAVICFLVMLVLHLATPYWWWTMLVPFAYSLMRAPTVLGGISTGAVSAGLLWLLGGVYAWSTGSEIILSRIAVTMRVGAPVIVLIMTAALAAIAGGLAGGAGFSLRAAFRPNRTD